MTATGRDYGPPARLYRNSYYTKALSELAGDSVLELGCANGRVGEMVRQHAPHVRTLIGVELDGNLLAATPPGIYTRLVQSDLDDPTLQVAEPITDVLALDVAEHLKYPRDVLAKVCDLLPVGGRIVIGVPNFLHHKNRRRIALGKWAYDADGGLYDEGHLRWFSDTNIHQLLPDNVRLLSVSGHGWFPRGARLARRPALDRVVEWGLATTYARAIAIRPRLLAQHLVVTATRLPDEAT